MSSELSHFFPSAIHPALPVAAGVLSTLRNLTAPGKGNDIRPEERAALVGVSALLACEKIQSKDLVEKTAQKAASVSPAHFRSALRRARELLASQPAEANAPSPPRRTSSRSAVSSTEPSSTSAQESLQSPSAPSPFSTPKKKFKYSSGVDFSGLVKHSPAKGSPLKQSVTPRRRTAADERITEDDDEEEEEEQDISTPTKIRRIRSNPTTEEQGEADVPRTSKKRTEEDMAAFFALKPGIEGTASAITTPIRFRGFAHEPEVRERVKRTEAERKNRRVRRKRDWTFREEVWGGVAVQRKNDKMLQQLGM